MFCTCGKALKAGFTALQEDGTHNYDMWVCGNCRLLPEPKFQKETAMLTPFNATRLTSIKVHGDGRHIHSWRLEDGSAIQTMTFVTYPRKVDMQLDHGRSVLVKFWKELDKLIDDIRLPYPRAEVITESYKAQATTYAEVLAELMSPFYADGTAVLAESMARWEARQRGTEHQSPGLAEAIWDPSSRFDGTPYSTENEAAVRSGGVKTMVKLDEQKTNFVKTMIGNGSMTVEVLAGMFNVTPDVIQAAYDRA